MSAEVIERQVRNLKNKKDSSDSAGGIGFTGLLTIAFIVLKLCKVIEWLWLWVLSPLWISAILAIILLVIYIIL